jgi:hypothetical protein
MQAIQPVSMLRPFRVRLLALQLVGELVVLTLCGGNGSASFVTKPDLMWEPLWHVLADMCWMGRPLPLSDPAHQQGVSQEEQGYLRDGDRGEGGQVRQPGGDGEHHPDAGGGVEGVE